MKKELITQLKNLGASKQLGEAIRGRLWSMKKQCDECQRDDFKDIATCLKIITEDTTDIRQLYVEYLKYHDENGQIKTEVVK